MSQQSFRQELQRLLVRGEQSRIASAVGVSPQTVSDWKHGRRTPRPSHVEALERALGLDAGALSHHLGYVPLAAQDQDRYETEVLLDAAHHEVQSALAGIDLPLDQLVDDIDEFARKAAATGIRFALGRLAVELFEREHGSFTEAELAEARAALDAATPGEGQVA